MSNKKKLASIEIVSAVTPADNSDNLEIVSLEGLGWQVVAQKGIHKVGDKVVFVIIDTLVERRPWNDFLFKGRAETCKEIKLSSVRLRGNISQGIIVPISKVPEAKRLIPLRVGKDYSKRFGVKKYTKVADVETGGKDNAFIRFVRKTLWKLGFKKLIPNYREKSTKDFPSFIPKTDEDNLASVKHVLEKIKDSTYGGLYVSLKLDGSSCTFFKQDGVDGVCSRNLEVSKEDTSAWAEQYRKYAPVLVDGFAIQGEIVGPAMNGNKMKLTEKKFVAFQVINLAKREILDYADFCKFCDDAKIERVPTIEVPAGWENWTVKEWTEFSAKVAKYGKEPGEGIVVRVKTGVNASFRGTHQGRLSFKVINPDYKEAE